MTSYYDKLSELAAANRPCVSVILVDTTGSAPQDRGAKMIVTSEGLYFGTVGGGKIEKKAIEEARRMLAEGAAGGTTRFSEWSLTRDVGMTCGGSVKLYFEAFNLNTWQIAVFGAGHVAQALVRVLADLDCRLTCIDPRADWLARLPDSPKLRKIETADMVSVVPALPDDTFVVLVTMGHSTDMPVLIEILRSRSFPYVGVIGSQAKAARLRKDVLASGLGPAALEAYRCPIGLAIGSNHPQEIAISIAAQLIEVRDLRAGRPSGKGPVPPPH